MKVSCSIKTALKRSARKNVSTYDREIQNLRSKSNKDLRCQAHLFYTKILYAFVLISRYSKRQTNKLITYCCQISFYSISKCWKKISQYWLKAAISLFYWSQILQEFCCSLLHWKMKWRAKTFFVICQLLWSQFGFSWRNYCSLKVS